MRNSIMPISTIMLVFNACIAQADAISFDCDAILLGSHLSYRIHLDIYDDSAYFNKGKLDSAYFTTKGSDYYLSKNTSTIVLTTKNSDGSFRKLERIIDQETGAYNSFFNGYLFESGRCSKLNADPAPNKF
jgi:hypothetical protein